MTSPGQDLFKVRTFQGGLAKNGPHLLVLAGIHGDEFESIFAVQRLIQYFISEQEFSGRLTLVPVANEGAFLSGGRVSDVDGLDLARTFPGRSDGSVTERVAWALSGLIADADLLIDLHTGGTALSVYPLSGYMLHQNAEILETQRKMARAFNLPFIWGTTASVEGRSLSVARDAGIPAIYAEYLGAATCNESGVDAYFEGCLNVMSAFGMLVRATPLSEVRDTVEDDEEESGHMQVCHPATMDGLFAAEVNLGDPIKKGDVLGRIVDFTGESGCDVSASKSGRVIVLRTFPRVRVGDSCGVIA